MRLKSKWMAVGWSMGLAMGLVLAGISGGAYAAGESIVHSKVYEADTQRKNLLFTAERTEKTEGDRTTITEVFKDPEGKQAVRLEGVVVGDQLLTYTIEQNQLGEKGKIEAKDGELRFDYTDKDGKTKHASEKLEANYVVGLTLRSLVKKNWKDLLDGKSVSMRFGVPERLETVGFKIFKDQELKANGKDVVVLKMKPTSMVIAAIVKPIYFFFDRADGKLLEFKGRVIPKQKTKSGYKDLVAETVYE